MNEHKTTPKEDFTAFRRRLLTKQWKRRNRTLFRGALINGLVIAFCIIVAIHAFSGEAVPTWASTTIYTFVWLCFAVTIPGVILTATIGTTPRHWIHEVESHMADAATLVACLSLGATATAVACCLQWLACIAFFAIGRATDPKLYLPKQELPAPNTNPQHN